MKQDFGIFVDEKDQRNMMRIIIAIFIMLDIVYQLFGKVHDVAWSAYYDIFHYAFLVAVCIYFIEDKLIRYFSVYSIVVLFTIIYQTICANTFYIDDPLYFWGYLVLGLLTFFSIHKLWAK